LAEQSSILLYPQAPNEATQIECLNPKQPSMKTIQNEAGFGFMQ